jgi:hypothetical protein
MKVLYIMGAGHIGSTILDIVLGSHPHFESLGEVSKYHRNGWKADTNRTCSCGEPVFECPFWVQARARWMELTGQPDPTRYVALQNRFESSGSGWLALLWNSIFSSSDFRDFKDWTAAFYQAIHEVGGKPVLVDSSLTPRRAFALAKNPKIDLHLIHMVRDGRGVIWSLMKPGKQALIRKEYVPAHPFKTTRYWLSANLQSLSVFNQVPEAKRRLVRYEDFVTNPSLTVQKIGEWVGEDLSDVISESGLSNPNPVRHTVGGNRVRMQKDIRIRADFAWQEHLPQKDRKLFWRTAGWLARRFGYLPQ